MSKIANVLLRFLRICIFRRRDTISKNAVMEQNVSKLDQMERFRLISSVDFSNKAFKYIKSKLKNLSINITGEYQGRVMKLSIQGLLLGRCWETTESAIVFLEDDDYIER